MADSADADEGPGDGAPAGARRWPAAGALLAALLAAMAVIAAGATRAQQAPSTPAATFAGSQACASCHAAESAAWSSSQHARAMMPAGEASVRGDFSGASARVDGSTGRFVRDGDSYVMETEGRDGRPGRFVVTHTLGVEPLQQYLATFPDGRVQVLPWAWDTRPGQEGGQRWFHVAGDHPPLPGSPLHWTGRQQTWNAMCAECHVTGFDKGYDAAANTYRSTSAELGVGCEGCHGPASGHLAWAARADGDPRKGFDAAWARRPATAWAPDPATGSPSVAAPRPAGDEVEACARCHSRRGTMSQHWKPGQPLEATHLPALLTEGLFEADGQMLDEVFNDHAFKQSLMYARGVVCSDCHEPHAGRLRAEGAQVCAQCHDSGRFAAATHTGHQPGPGGPDCIACHMPAKTYMVVDRRHDHSFRVPRPDLSAALGTPNTCASCHADKDPTWAAQAIERWHGPVRKGFQTWAGAFAAARQGDPTARDALIALASGPATPAVARATALDDLAGFPSAARDAALDGGLHDPAPLARLAAVRAGGAWPADLRRRRIGPLLDDPVLAVRAEAARALIDIPPASLSEAERTRLAAAFAEYEAIQRLDADRPEGRSNLAMAYLRQGRVQEAEAELLAGLRLDPTAAELAVNLADLYRQAGRETAAEQTLRQALSVSPGNAAARHALGLTLVRQKRYADALVELRKATDLDPADARYAYVYAVALQSTGQGAVAADVLERAASRHPWDASILAARLDAALRRGDAAAATPLAATLARLRPDDPQLAQLAASLAQRQGTAPAP